MKKKITVGTSIVFVFCVFCGAIANSISETTKTADYYLEKLAECYPAEMTWRANRPEAWETGLRKLGKEKFYYCIGAVFGFIGCAGKFPTDDYSEKKAFCACIATHEMNDKINTLSGEDAYYEVLSATGKNVDVARRHKIREEYGREQTKFDVVKLAEQCHKITKGIKK